MSFKEPRQTPQNAAHSRLILASGSARRQELLRAMGIEFEVCPADIAEELMPWERALSYALRLAREKAEKIARQLPQGFVLGADTIVVVDGEVLGKPRDPQDAVRMLRLLSGRSHEVTTAVCVIAPGKPADTRSSTSHVSFRRLLEDEIQRYVAMGEPMDKAGAYAIQGGAGRWVAHLEGDYTNVVGLPVSLVTEMLHTSGFLQV